MYKIDPDDLGEFEVFCDQKTAGGGWTLFQKRQDGSVEFFRLWNDYQLGFGNLNGEFWLGLDQIHRLTLSSSKLRVDLEDLENKTAFAEYSSFAVANETEKYKLSLRGYSGEITTVGFLKGKKRKIQNMLHFLLSLCILTGHMWPNYYHHHRRRRRRHRHYHYHY